MICIICIMCDIEIFMYWENFEILLYNDKKYKKIEFKNCICKGNYTGGIKNNKPHGNGSLIMDGDIYLEYHGMFKDGLFQGHGVLDIGDGDILNYNGDFKEGKYHGCGTYKSNQHGYIFKNCNFNEGLICGKVTILSCEDWDDKDNYSNHWVNGPLADLKLLNREKFYCHGFKYEGEFVDGRPLGFEELDEMDQDQQAAIN